MNTRMLGILAGMALMGCGGNERARAVCEGLIDDAFKRYEEALAPCVNASEEAGFLRRYTRNLDRCEDTLGDRCVEDELAQLEQFGECLKAIPQCVPSSPDAFLRATESCQQELEDVRTECQW
ncbi:hypothetical protein [Stigmatella erecta]|uniref:Uncharacterized protein n=1 Tax=Stigmatella erecta TaxID=83460 RepID=A0A1I0JSL4_9BACT|nr:hypothetical protein [Stigmatella erecta]SEU13736.1 hypothetical protein SAMN05443639_10868 [Stigmatella erecta]